MEADATETRREDTKSEGTTAQQNTPLQRIAEPEEVARTALWLVSSAAAYVTGQIIVMDGGGSV